MFNAKKLVYKIIYSVYLVKTPFDLKRQRWYYAPTFVRRTRVRRTKNPTWLKDIVLVHVLLYVYEAEKVVHVQKYEVK